MLLLSDSSRMSKVCETWSLEDLCNLKDEDMERLLGFYKPGKVPKLVELRVLDDPAVVGFDGSFGWW